MTQRQQLQKHHAAVSAAAAIGRLALDAKIPSNKKLQPRAQHTNKPEHSKLQQSILCCVLTLLNACADEPWTAP
jgi:hypothetical protein